MYFETKKQAKTTVSALRRELKGFTKPASELSHSECLTILAKALGHKSWNELEAKLPDDSPLRAAAAKPVERKYPLKNTGQFDFVKPGEDGKPVHGSFMELIGACELVPGTCSAASATRRKDGLDFQGDGETELSWDEQHTERNAKGETLWLNGDCKIVPESALVLLPEDYEGDPEDDDLPWLEDEDELPVRDVLLAAYRTYFAEEGITLTETRSLPKTKALLEKAAAVIGFALTKWEIEALQHTSDAGTTGAVKPAEDVDLEMQAYRQVFNRLFADEGDEAGTPSVISKVMEALAKATLREQNKNAETFLRQNVSELFTLNGPYDGYCVAQLASELRARAKTAYERLVLKTRR
ncbi:MULTISPECIES: glyoxalase superfamily protein [unclassified Variovorax]|uniref:glyoxalase superfamily protein n=1 Tax=unclassified Variovorax TaxID=663243 RepID=UPI001317E956|nr:MULTISPECIES: glyoxalase superfamily protein [unclassified Variovorax]VTU42823.1 hypothetical protein H6P1_00288 [Variovorax sp. PBL-H6]VTU43652.1 hypothetical protein SRS16P1_00616 [Variovorax sp. SRS16]VTU43716.1 hypothetical protein E5P1_00610 [Variovorax sp. PBL-E5]